MHEWALAESVVKTLKNQNRRISRAEVILGELQDIDEEIFTFALKEILKQEHFNLHLKICKEEAVFECLSCGANFGIKKGLENTSEKENVHFLPEMVKVFLKCPECGSKDFEIIKGRGLSIRIRGK